jgi:hypothetical protein
VTKFDLQRSVMPPHVQREMEKMPNLEDKLSLPRHMTSPMCKACKKCSSSGKIQSHQWAKWTEDAVKSAQSGKVFKTKPPRSPKTTKCNRCMGYGFHLTEYGLHPIKLFAAVFGMKFPKHWEQNATE